MKNFLKLLCAGMLNLYICFCCIGSFYNGVHLFIRMSTAKGFMAIGLFFLGIVIMFLGVFFLLLIGFVTEYFLTHYDDKGVNENGKD